MNKLFENEAKTAVVFENTTARFLLLRLSGRLSFEEYKTVMLFLIEKSQEKRIKQVIMNNYDLEYDTPKSRIWFLTTFIYKVQRTLGEQIAVAVIRPHNNFQKIATNTLVNLVQSQGFQFEIRFCSNENDAMSWFEEHTAQE